MSDGHDITEPQTTPLNVVVYPEPEELSHLTLPLATLEVFEVRNAEDHVIADDAAPRDHPEVPLTIAERDSVLATLGFRRVGPWHEDDGFAKAPVSPTPSVPIVDRPAFVADEAQARLVVQAHSGFDPHTVTAVIDWLHERGWSDSRIVSCGLAEINEVLDRFVD